MGGVARRLIKATGSVFILGSILLAPAGAAISLPATANVTEVDADTATVLGEAAAQEVFGPITWIDITPYLDPELNVCVYAIEYARQDNGAAVTVIASARRDDVPVIMMWDGYPRHSDPDVLAMAVQDIQDRLSVVVGEPDAIFWLDIMRCGPRFRRSTRSPANRSSTTSIRVKSQTARILKGSGTIGRSTSRSRPRQKVQDSGIRWGSDDTPAGRTPPGKAPGLSTYKPNGLTPTVFSDSKRHGGRVQRPTGTGPLYALY